jgi:omega-6 fatty acid desaturase (delta-12 desaturase)
MSAIDVRAYAVEDPAKTWRLLLELLFAIMLAEAATLVVAPWPFKLAGAVLLGLLQVRVYIFVHDALHGSIFRRSRPGKWLMIAAAHYLLTPPSYWKYSHNRHHARNGELVGSLIGELPLVDVAAWRAMPVRERLAYRVTRHPANLVFAYATIFLGMQCIYALASNPRRHWDAALTLVAHFAGLAAIVHFFGVETAFFNALLPMVITMAIGGVLFYMQHNAPGLNYAGRGSRDLAHAALHSTTMFDMGPVMHWFTGNIGYHHVHHVNPGIPFYRLPEAMAGCAELQNPVRVKWADLAGCLSVSVWDPAARRMVSYDDAA